MKQILFYLIGSLAELTFAIFAGLLALDGKPGWGWFIFAAIASQLSISRSTSKSDGKSAEAQSPQPAGATPAQTKP